MESHEFQEDVLCIAWPQIYQENTLGITPKTLNLVYLVMIALRIMILYNKISADKAKFKKGT